jgi:hypothetical protein
MKSPTKLYKEISYACRSLPLFPLLFHVFPISVSLSPFPLVHPSSPLLSLDCVHCQNANSAAQETTNQLRSERDELEGLWNTSQEDLQSLRRRLEDTERHLAMLETERDKLQQQPQSPPLPQSQQLSSPSAAPQPHSPPQPSPQQQQQSPPLSTAQGAGGGAGVRRGGGAGDRFDALASKLLFMSDRLSRIDP